MKLLRKSRLYKFRFIFISLITWLPLLILAIFGRTAFANVDMPFILDYDVHVRFLLVLSMLLIAEMIAHERLQLIVEQFGKCNLIARGDKTRFNKIIDSAVYLRDSLLAQGCIVILVYSIGLWISTALLPLNISSWFANTKLTTAGYWYVFVSLPIFQFILFRWYFRIVVWYRFLWQISRLPLQLNSLHPDRSGGLGFLSLSIYALTPFLLAHTTLLAGLILTRTWNTGSLLTDFRIETLCVFILVLIIPIIPLLFFCGQMSIEKRLGTLRYAAVANLYVNDFRQKWIAKNNPAILGTSDIQSLADLSNSFEVTNNMRITPFSKTSILVLAIVTASPLFIVMLTTIPVDKIVNQIFRLIF